MNKTTEFVHNIKNPLVTAGDCTSLQGLGERLTSKLKLKEYLHVMLYMAQYYTDVHRDSKVTSLKIIDCWTTVLRFSVP